MTISVHIACDDPTYRETIARLLERDDAFYVLAIGHEDKQGVEDLNNAEPDVTVLAVPPGEDVLSHARMYVKAAGGTTGLVGFCTLDPQADAYRQAGVDTLVYAKDTGDELSQAVARAAHKQ
jgi:DNA-binding NarL/FixJ family response regulator